MENPMNIIPNSFLDLLDDQAKALCFLATTMGDGSPQVSPVWFDWDGENIFVNSAKGRLKDKNMRARPEVAMTIMKLDSPYRYLLLRGKIVEITSENALAHINKLSQKYRGSDWPTPEDQTRVLYKFEIEKVFQSIS
jgi:PPOX class probable F420-dependent enzyme